MCTPCSRSDSASDLCTFTTAVRSTIAAAVSCAIVHPLRTTHTATISSAYKGCYTTAIDPADTTADTMAHPCAHTNTCSIMQLASEGVWLHVRLGQCTVPCHHGCRVPPWLRGTAAVSSRCRVRVGCIELDMRRDTRLFKSKALWELDPCSSVRFGLNISDTAADRTTNIPNFCAYVPAITCPIASTNDALANIVAKHSTAYNRSLSTAIGCTNCLANGGSIGLADTQPDSGTKGLVTDLRHDIERHVDAIMTGLAGWQVPKHWITHDVVPHDHANPCTNHATYHCAEPHAHMATVKEADSRYGALSNLSTL